MPNIHKRQTDRGLASVEKYELAIEEVTIRNASLRNAAKSSNLCYVSLHQEPK